ncbi:hypothetical protein ACOME3_000204 [Neoechinorhynchus agilis]
MHGGLSLEGRTYREWVADLWGAANGCQFFKEKMDNEQEATEENGFPQKGPISQRPVRNNGCIRECEESKDQSDPEVLKVSTWSHKGRQMERTNSDEQGKSATMIIKTCLHCGRKRNDVSRCRAKTMVCYKCNRVGHLSRCCKTFRVVQQIIVRDSSDDEAIMRCIGAVKRRKKRKFARKSTGSRSLWNSIQELLSPSLPEIYG